MGKIHLLCWTNFKTTEKSWTMGQISPSNPLDIEKVNVFQLQGDFAPDPLIGYKGLCPWTPLWALPPDPRYRLALSARHSPKAEFLDPPLINE